MTAIIWPRTDGDRPPADFEKRLCSALKGRVEKAYLFGSYGTKDFRHDSDIDLILVTETERPFVDRPQLFNDLYELYPRLDLLVYTPAELKSQLTETTGFWASVKTTLRELPVG